MLTPTNAANYPATEQRIDCSQFVEALQENPAELIRTLDKAMSRIMPNVLNSGVQLTATDVNEYHQLKTVRDILIKATFGIDLS